MDTRLERMAECLLTQMLGGSLSDALVYEFAEQSCVCICEQKNVQKGDSWVRLWDYLSSGRTSLNCDNRDGRMAFRQGQIYAIMELLNMVQQQMEAENTLEEDAKTYGRHWHTVFRALSDGKSLTHKELAGQCNLSDSSLSQFMRKIESKHYIHVRKAGRTKYYRLSSKGRELWKCICLNMRTDEFINAFARKPYAFGRRPCAIETKPYAFEVSPYVSEEVYALNLDMILNVGRLADRKPRKFEPYDDHKYEIIGQPMRYVEMKKEAVHI